MRFAFTEMQVKRISALMVVVTLALLTSSCSGRARVSGRITFNGKPLPAGRIIFIGANGKASDPTDIADGKYDVPNAPIGECKIQVQTSYMLTMLQSMPGMGGMPGMGPAGMPDMSNVGSKMPNQYKDKMNPMITDEMRNMKAKIGEYLVIIPDEYENPEKTLLTFTVKSGSNEHDVELTGPERKVPTFGQ